MEILAISNDLSGIKKDVRKYFKKHLLYKRHCILGDYTIKVLHYDACEINKIFEAHKDEMEVLNNIDKSGRTFVELKNIHEIIYKFYTGESHNGLNSESKLYTTMYLLVRKLAWFEYDIFIHDRFISDFEILTNVAIELGLFEKEN